MADARQSISHHLQLRIVGHPRTAVQLPGALQDVGGGQRPGLKRGRGMGCAMTFDGWLIICGSLNMGWLMVYDGI